MFLNCTRRFFPRCSYMLHAALLTHFVSSVFARPGRAPLHRTIHLYVLFVADSQSLCSSFSQRLRVNGENLGLLNPLGNGACITSRQNFFLLSPCDPLNSYHLSNPLTMNTGELLTHPTCDLMTPTTPPPASALSLASLPPKKLTI